MLRDADLFVSTGLDLEIREVGVDCVDRCAPVPRQPFGLCETDRGRVDSGDVVAEIREEHGVAAFSLCEAEDPAFRDGAGHRDEEPVGFGTKGESWF